MNTLGFILGIIVLIAAAIAFFVMASWGDLQEAAEAETGRLYTQWIEEIFQQVWNGEECSRAAAWFRTVEHLKRNNYPHEMVVEAELRLMLLEAGDVRSNRSDYKVNNNGRLVHITQLGGNDVTGEAPVA